MTLRRTVLALVMATLTILPAAPASATTAFTVSGTQIGHEPPRPEQLLPDYFAGDTIARVDYPAALFRMDRSIAVAVQGLTAGLLSTDGAVIAAGFSQGAVAVAYAKEELMALPVDQRPAPDELTFVTIGDPAGPHGILKVLPFRVPLIGLTPITAPDTPYDSIIVNGEYDGWGDFPDRPWHLLSVLNALMGTTYVHGRYETIPGGLDLSTVPPENITTTVNKLGGTTTSYLIPTDTLPLVQPLRDLGVSDKIVTALEKPLKKIVDRGYSRNRVPHGTPAQTRHPQYRTAATAPTARRHPQGRAAA